MKLAETRPKELKTSPRRKQKSDSSGESYLTDDVTDNKSKGTFFIEYIIIYNFSSIKIDVKLFMYVSPKSSKLI